MKLKRAAVAIAAGWIIALFSTHLASAQTAHDILFIGDSHTVGTFGNNLDRWIRSQLRGNATLASYGSCASRISHWYQGFTTTCRYVERPRSYDHETQARIIPARRGRTPSIRRLLRRDRPSLTIVELGANQLGYTENYNRRWMRQIKADIRTFSHYCVWIGPPDGPNKSPENMQTFYNLLRTEMSDTCTIVDSRAVTHPVAGYSNPHFDSMGPQGLRIAEDWVNYAARAISPFLNR